MQPHTSLRDRLQRLDGPHRSHEQPEYLDRGGEQLYCVWHGAVGERRGGVLLAPPFARERMDAYTTLVTWARRLAASGFDVARFDYRGTGESTGRFEDFDLRAWLDDLHAAAATFAARLQGRPLLLHGLRLGALLAAVAFAAGRGDGMLLWDPPAHAKELLFEVLRGKLLEDMALGIGGARKTRDAYLADLEAGGLVEVDGHPWSRALWHSAAELALPVPDAAEPRPWQSIQLVRNPKLRSVAAGETWKVPIPQPPFWKDHPHLVPDLGDLFDVSCGWLATAATEAAR